MEGIDISNSSWDWFRDYALHPQPGNIAPPYTPGWIEIVANATAFSNVVASKFARIVTTTQRHELSA